MPRLLRTAPFLLLALLTACHSAPKPAVWKLELMTNPGPPVAGASTLFRVLLTNGGGEPIDGGAAVVALTLPASSAPLVQVPLAPRGSGVYEGRATLPSAGDWTATVTMTIENHTEIRRFPIAVGGSMEEP